MRFLTIALLASAVLAAPASAAVFNFTYSGAGITASGQLTTAGTVASNGFDLVTALSGQRNGEAIGLLAPGSFGGNDNLINIDAANPFTNNGLTFRSTLTGTSFNLFTPSSQSACNNRTVEASSANADILCSNVTTVAFTLTPATTGAVPEPATWAMLLVGFGMVAGTARYRRRTATVVYN